MATTVWKGYLSFGLLSIPVRLFKAARAEKIHFHQVRKVREPEPEDSAPEIPSAKPGPVRVAASGHDPAPDPAPDPEPEVYERVHQQATAPREEIVKGYEYAKDQFVVMDKEDLKPLAAPTSTALQILEFVTLAEIDPIFYETSYYLMPEEAGEKPYALLFSAMRKSGYVALAEIAMHRREHVMVIRSGRRGLLAHTMFYEDEIRADQEYTTDTSQVNAKEERLAQQLIESLAAPFDASKYKDKTREAVKARIDEKVAGREVSPSVVPAAKPAAVLDIMDALRNSLQLARKPALREASGKPAAKPKQRRAGGS